MMKSDQQTLPLSDITVVQWGGDTATALCGLLLADLGAQVVLVEPLGGREERTFTPPMINGESVLFLTLNRGKQSIAIDPGTGPGKAALRTLCTFSDVVLEGHGTPTLHEFGLTYEVLKRRNKAVIFYSINAYGKEGWYSQEPGGELEAQAVTGLDYLGQCTRFC